MRKLTNRASFIISMVLFFCLNSELFAQSKDEKSIREETPSLGSTLRKKLATSSISMDKKYNELSEEEKESIKSVYEDMPDEDEPPYPINGMRDIYGKMSQAQQWVGAKGKLTMTVDVNSAGEPETVSIYESPDPDLARVAALVLMETKYKPAVCNGVKCKMQFFFQVTFGRIL